MAKVLVKVVPSVPGDVVGVEVVPVVYVDLIMLPAKNVRLSNSGYAPLCSMYCTAVLPTAGIFHSQKDTSRILKFGLQKF